MGCLSNSPIRCAHKTQTLARINLYTIRRNHNNSESAADSSGWWWCLCVVCVCRGRGGGSLLLNTTYFPGDVNSFAWRIYFISGVACDREIGKSRGKVTSRLPASLRLTKRLWFEKRKEGRGEKKKRKAWMTTAEETQPAWAFPGLIERVQRSEPLRSGSEVKIKDGRPSCRPFI